jgi:hypothetical protein
MKVHTIIVFPDGETWNTVDGCTIKTIADPDFRALCDDAIDASECKAIAEMRLLDFAPGTRTGNAK